MLCRSFAYRCLGVISFSHEMNTLATKCRHLSPSQTGLSWLPELDPSASQRKKKHDELITQLWHDMERIAARAHALKETDSVYSILQMLLNKGYYPPNLNWWTLLSRFLLPFGDVESHTVMQYPGGVECASSNTSGTSPCFASLHSEEFTRGTPIARGSYLYASRQTLLMTGGVIPLSAKYASANGTLLSRWVSQYVSYVRRAYFPSVLDRKSLNKSDHRNIVETFPESLPSHIVEFTISILESLEKNQRSIRLTAILDSMIDLLYLLWESCVLSAAKSWKPPSSEGGGASLMEILFSKVISRALNLTYHGVGPVLLLHFYASLPISCWTGEEPSVWGLLSARERPHLLSQCSLTQLDSLLNVLQVTKYLQNEIHDDILQSLQDIERSVDRIFQYNANHDNLLRINAEKEPTYRIAICEVLLSAMRHEAVSPDRFLREAMAIVERCPASMTIEAELLSAKVQLLEVFDLDHEGKSAVYKDLLTSLRNLVDLRPRHSSDSPEYDSSSGVVDGSLTDLMDGQPNQLDPASQIVMQRAHEEVITVFSESQDDMFLNEAYGIIISHKYHGLVITRSIIKPLLKAFASRGDGRVFNLVDLCVLYSNNIIDVEVLGYLFQTCAVNGDYFRARTLLKLLEDNIPGFLLKATEEIKEQLRSLSILPYEDQHLFMSEEDISVNEALGRPPTPLRPLL